ncbi:secreted protein, partial [gut metagenome]
MKIRPTHLCVLIAMALSFAVSCDDDETYADRREREDKQIRS